MKQFIIAHRGASYLASHENTLEAFQLAIDIGADYVEFDIRRTKDRKLIVFHDNEINGCNISDLTYTELQAAVDYKIPYLIDVLNMCQGKIKLDIELKEAGYENQIIRMVTEMYHYDEFMMKSFLDTAVARIKSIDPNITAGLLVGTKTADTKRRFNEYFPERRMKDCKADFIAPHYSIATREFVFRMHRKHKKIYVWTVNGIPAITKYLKRNVDGIITDMPDAGVLMKERMKR